MKCAFLNNYWCPVERWSRLICNQHSCTNLFSVPAWNHVGWKIISLSWLLLDWKRKLTKKGLTVRCEYNRFPSSQSYGQPRSHGQSYWARSRGRKEEAPWEWGYRTGRPFISCFYFSTICWLDPPGYGTFVPFALTVGPCRNLQELDFLSNVKQLAYYSNIGYQISSISDLKFK